MKIQLILLLLLNTVIACSEGYAPLPSQKLNNGTDDHGFNDANVCYPGQNPQKPNCYLLTNSNSLGEQSAKYNYTDPNTDPSFPSGFSKQQYRQPKFFLDLRTIPANDFLTENFRVNELMWPGEDRGYFGIYSSIAIQTIQQLRNDLASPMRISSGYRSPSHNATLPGAAKWSRHTYGDAIDFKTDGYTFEQLAEKCLAHGASYYQIYQTHIHCDWRNDRLDESFYPPTINEPSQIQDKMTLRQEVIDAITNHTSVVINEVRIQQQEPLLHFKIKTIQEDSGQLQVDWLVITPDGNQIQSSQNVLRIKKHPGLYQIQVRVGGSVEIIREIQIN